MSLDLYQDEAQNALANLPPVKVPEADTFDGFLRGSAKYAMRGFAKAGSALQLTGSVPAILIDKITGGTELQDKYFKEHDDVFKPAVDYWTPKPNEVGTAGEVVGSLVSMLPMVMASPSLTVAATQMGTAEDLSQQGVDSTKAQAVGAVQAAGLGLGIWMPILGKNLWQRVLLGGAGFNVIQGAATRGASGEILKGTPQEEQFKAFDGKALTLDVLLGAAFGTMAHVSPAQRAQGAEVWGKIENWAKNLKPSEVDAVAELRQAQHMNVDSMPGKPVDAQDIEAHVNRMKTAIDQMVKDEPVEVSDLPQAKYADDPARTQDAINHAAGMQAEAEKIRTELGIPHPDEINAQAKTIGESITDRLKSIGVDETEAKANGAIWESFFRTAGQRYGIAPEKLMQQYGLDIKRIGPEGMTGALEQGAVATETPEFKNWFGDSKVVDAEGKPLVVYHGTNADFFKFAKSKSREDGTFFFTPSTRVAGDFATYRSTWPGANIVPVFLKATNPLHVDGNGADIRQVEDTAKFPGMKYGETLREYARREGYDAIVFKNVRDAVGPDIAPVADVYAVFKPTQIKSAIGNRGTFDPNDPNILNQFAGPNAQTQRGAIQFGNGKTIIGLFENADKSTFLHESGHFFLNVTRDLSAKPGAPEMAAKDWATLSDWLGIKDGEIPREAHEKFAEGFEQYLKEGKAPTPELSSVFHQFRDWLVEIYRSLKDSVGLTDDVRGVMDRMLSSQESSRTESRPSQKPETVSTPRSAQAEVEAGPSPLSLEAERVSNEMPDIKIPVGMDENGEPITQNIREYLDNAKTEVELARNDAKLFTVAAQCMLGIL